MNGTMDDIFLADALANLKVEIINNRVHCPRDMFSWERSEAMADVVSFVERMNVVVKRYRGQAGHCPGEKQDVSARPSSTDRVMEVLRNVGDWATEHKPLCRSGVTVGLSFRKFYNKLHIVGYDLLIRMYGRQNDHRTVELPVYLEKSFGDPDTMTYGLEHELSFCMFLVALFKLHHLTCADEPYIVTVLFHRYLDVAKYLIKNYGLEPSTTYGSLGLNDYWYVAFLWGSAQLAGSEEQHDLSPASAVADEVAARWHGGKYVFMKCMDAVHCRAKSRATDGTDYDDDDDDDDEDGAGVGEAEEDEMRRRRRVRPPLWWHSYQLWNLTALRRWDDVNDRLMAAFRWQVLDHYDVVRHLAFGELLKFTPNPRPPGVSFYDCIPVAHLPYAKSCPGAVAHAAAEEGSAEEDGGELVGAESRDDVQSETFE